MKKNNDLNDLQKERISPTFFLPSYTFIFYLIKNHLNLDYFHILIISLYLPPLIILLLTRNTSTSEKSSLKESFNELKDSFKTFDYIPLLKELFINSIYTIINIFGMITFYSIITLIIPNIFIKGLFEFSIPTLSLLTSNYNSLIKTYLILIILAFSSLSSISQASIYFDEQLTLMKFTKKRVIIFTLSLLLFTVLINLYFYFR